jgi:predicted transcriptional regulator
MLKDQEATSVKLGYRKELLQALADESGVSVDSIILDAVDNHLDKMKAKNAYDRRALHSYQDYQESGLHITLEEFSQWVDTLDTDEPQEMPKCHK